MYSYTYGFPITILTDNGKEFKNQEMETFCKENGIKQRISMDSNNTGPWGAAYLYFTYYYILGQRIPRES